LTDHTPTQLPLNLARPQEPSFANFYAANNQQTVLALKQRRAPAQERVIYLWGPSGSGKSHLLQAACRDASENHQQCTYINLSQRTELTPAALEGLEQLQLVCLDNVDAAAGQPEWEAALFHLYNRILDRDGRLLIAGHSNVYEIPFTLADLKSRLTWGLVFRLHPLSDSGKIIALQMRMEEKGLVLSREVALFLITRYQRDPQTLFNLADRLDRASLAAQRRLTIPFVKSTLSEHCKK